MKNYLLLILVCSASLYSTAQTRYILGKESKLTIDGTSTVHDWKVTANTMEGSLKSNGITPKEIDFQVIVADIKSERGATMDKKMHAALQKEAHPKVMFVLKEVKSESILVGTLTIAGHSQEVEISGMIIESADDTIKISGQYPIALKDFQIEPPTAMFGQVIVGDNVTVTFDLIFKQE